MADLSVSVVVPVFNGEAYLRESLDSILGQTCPPTEVIVMDDGSTDSTPEILASYGDRIRHVRQPANRGIYCNANDGIALASGDLVGVFHADDVYLPTLLERQVTWLEFHPSAGAVFCADIFIDAEGRELGRLELPPEVRGERPLGYATIVNALLTHSNSFLRCPTALVRADVHAQVGVYRPDLYKNTSDLDMWLRIARERDIGIIEDHLVAYRRGHGSSSERYHRIRTDPFRFFEIMDAELTERGFAVARAPALRSYEAHRAVDTVMRSVSHYILGDRGTARALLRGVSLATLVRGREVRRARMIVLTVGLRALVRLPRIAAVGRLFERRWHPDVVGSR